MTVRADADAGVLHLTIAAPERRNALSKAVLTGLRHAITSAAGENVRAIVLSGAGGAFSAGADFTDLNGTIDDLGFDDEMESTVAAVRHAPVPVIAAIEGPCLGAAVELALACDDRIAGESAWLQVPAVHLGILYNPRSIARLHRTLPRTTVSRLLLCGERFTAAAAQRAGLVGDVVADGQALHKASTAAAQAGFASREAVAQTKKLLSELDDGEADLRYWHRVRADLLGSDERRRAVASARLRYHA